MDNMTIDKKTYKFLSDLQRNNDRDWFTEHKPRYVDAHDNAKAFATHLGDLMQKHDHIEAPKVFRIYRDVRFSTDKTPYKTNLGIGISRATDALRGGMYVNLEPGNTFAGGGFWAPNGPDLKRIRNEISVNAGEFRKIIEDETFVETFGSLNGESLKTAPRGFAKDHPDVDLLRMKQFLISQSFSDKEATSDRFGEMVSDTFRAMRPFFDFMSDVLTTDENGESLL